MLSRSARADMIIMLRCERFRYSPHSNGFRAILYLWHWLDNRGAWKPWKWIPEVAEAVEIYLVERARAFWRDFNMPGACCACLCCVCAPSPVHRSFVARPTSAHRSSIARPSPVRRSSFGRPQLVHRLRIARTHLDQVVIRDRVRIQV